MNETSAPSPAADDWGLSDVPAVKPKITLFRYMWCQPFLMVFFGICLDKIRDPMCPVLPYIVLGTVFTYFLALLSLPVWYFAYLYQKKTACSQRGLLTTPEGWLRLTTGTVPLMVLWLPIIVFADEEQPSIGRLLHAGTFALPALIASVVGTAHFIYSRLTPGVCAPEVAMQYRRRANRWLAASLVLVLLGVLVSAHILLNISDMPSSRRLLAKVVPAEVALNARNVHMFAERGYMFSGGDPTFHNFRFDADPATVLALIRSTTEERKGIDCGEEDVKRIPRAPDWWLIGRGQHYRLDGKEYWFDSEHSRVYLSAHLSD